MPNQPRHILGIDFGGSSLKAAVADTAQGLLLSEPVRREASVDITPEETLATVREMINNLNWRGPVGLGYPGVVKRGVCLSAANISKQWLGLNAEELLHSVVDDRVAVINDADAAGLAELKFGAAQSEGGPDGRVVLMLTLGTGIGSAFFYRGQLFPNTEFGHIELLGGDAEKYAAASVRVRESLDWKDWGTRLNRYLQEMEKLVSPDLIVLGGGISENFDKYRPFLSTRATIAVASLGNDAGILGAALAVETPV